MRIFAPVFKNEGYRFGKISTCIFRRSPLAIRPRNFWRVGNEPIAILFDNCFKLVTHNIINYERARAVRLVSKALKTPILQIPFIPESRFRFRALLAPVRFFILTMLPKRLLALILFAAFVVMPTCVLRAQWVPANGVGGNTAFCYASVGQYFFVGTDRGIIRSSDSGLTWTVANSGLTSDTTSSFAVIGNVLFAAPYVGGVFRSTDFGESWASVNNGLSTGSLHIPLQVTSLAAIGSNLIAGTIIYGSFVARSTDSGNTWTPISDAGLENPNNQGIQTLTVVGTNIIACSNDLGAYSSTDNGNTWTHIGYHGSAFDPACIAGMGSTLFAYFDLDGILSSTDNGANWTVMSTRWSGINNDTTINTLFASGSNLFVGTYNGIFRSTDSGRNWTAVDSGLTFDRVITFGAYGPDLFAGTTGMEGPPEIDAGGLFRSTDNGLSWNSVNISLSTSGVGITSVVTCGKYLFASSAEPSMNGVFRSTDYGTSWVGVNTGPLSGYPSMAINALAVCGTTMVAGNDNGALRSTDFGAHWLSTNAYGVKCLAVSGATLFAGDDKSQGGVFLSTDSGATWSLRNPFFSSWDVSAIATDGSTIFTNGGGVVRSTDNGETWTSFGSNPDPHVYSLAMIGSHLFAGTGNGVCRSTDQGATWHWVNSNLPTQYEWVYALAVSGSNIFAGFNNQGGLYLSTNEGNSWSSVATGLVDSSIATLTVIGNYLFAGMPSGGVWRRPLSDFGISSVAQTSTVNSTQSEIHIFPNPFSQSTQINFTSQTAGYAEVSIVNMLGVEVARVFSGELGAGEHSFVWSNPTGLPDGVYECLVRMNGQENDRISTMETLPVVLMR